MKRYAMNILSVMAMVVAVTMNAGCEKDVRQPAVAGAFYPSDPKMLSEAVDSHLKAAVRTQAEGDLVALIVPHAGYEFSAGVAAYSYKQVEGADYDTVVILGTSHKFRLNGASVWAGDAVSTPLGEIPVDRDVAAALIDEDRNVVFEPRAHENEHSIEVQFPFIQKVLPDAKVVPVAVGTPNRETMDWLAMKLAELVGYGKKKVLLVISTDWSHYHDYDTCKKMDMMGIEAVRGLSDFELKVRNQMGQAELCGFNQTLIALDVANRLKADDVKVFDYANSGDVTGEKDRVVGYAAMGIYKTGRGPKDELSGSEKKILVDIARSTVESYVKTGKAPMFVLDDPTLGSLRGAFVTLKRKGRLRGCIGNFFASGPLFETVRTMAINAAVNDNRFKPVTPQELDDIEVEVSVLSPLRRVLDVRDIEVGRHGIYIIKGRNRGVLLPQVAVENGWDRDEFLRQTCHKAGLQPDDWKEGADIYIFTAQVFGESDTSITGTD